MGSMGGVMRGGLNGRGHEGWDQWEGSRGVK